MATRSKVGLSGDKNIEPTPKKLVKVLVSTQSMPQHPGTRFVRGIEVKESNR